MAKTAIFYRAASNPNNAFFGERTWWSKDEDVARKYMKTQGFGGPFLYSAKLISDHVLDLVGVDTPHAWKDSDGIARLTRELIDLKSLNRDDEDDFLELHQGEFCHDVIDSLEDHHRRALSELYDWIAIIDSFTESEVMYRVTNLREEKAIKLIG